MDPKKLRDQRMRYIALIESTQDPKKLNRILKQYKCWLQTVNSLVREDLKSQKIVIKG